MTDLKEQTFFDVVEKVATVTEEKLANAVEFYSEKKVIPKNTIAGIDLTRGGEHMRHEDHEAHQKKVTILNRQREALKLAVAHWKAMILPKVLFDEIRKPLGLFTIYPSSYNNWYVIDNDAWGDEVKKSKEVVDNNQVKIDGLRAKIESRGGLLEVVKMDWRVFRFNLGVLVFTLVYLFLGHIGWTAVGAINLLGLVGSGYIFLMYRRELRTIRNKNYKKKKSWLRIESQLAKLERKQEEAKDNLNQAMDLSRAFKDLTMKNRLYQDLELYMKRREKALVQVKLPTPPPEVVEVISDVVRKLQKRKEFQIVTIADQEAIGLDIQFRIIPAPISTPAREVDPGIFIEYGEFVALLPDTFYHVTPLEQTFIDKVNEVAEQWDARSYIFN